MAGIDLAAAAITGGIGAALGAVGAALVQVFGKRGESRATAADLVTNAAGRMVERLDHDNAQLREAILLLTDGIDEVILICGRDASPEALEKLKAAKRSALLAI